MQSPALAFSSSLLFSRSVVHPQVALERQSLLNEQTVVPVALPAALPANRGLRGAEEQSTGWIEGVSTRLGIEDGPVSLALAQQHPPALEEVLRAEQTGRLDLDPVDGDPILLELPTRLAQ